MPTAPCAPCRARKLKCDRLHPSCSSCIDKGFICPGFKKNLSWPKTNDRKRFVVGPEPRVGNVTHRAQDTTVRWANVQVGDIVAHSHISLGRSLRGSDWSASPLSFRLGPHWTPTKLESSDFTLLQYFQEEAALAITCGHNGEYLVSVVTRLAFHDDSSSSQAVLHAVLAVASLRRQGSNVDTIGRQGAALRALERSARTGITGAKIIQHIAAGVLLCCFEIFGKDRTTGPWFQYIRNTKKLLQGLSLTQHIGCDEFLAMTNWLFHHDVHSQFSLRHWRHGAENSRSITSKSTERLSVRENTELMTEIVKDLSEITRISTASHMVLWPMADIFENLVDSSHPKYHDEAYRRELAGLERTLESILNGKHGPETCRQEFKELVTTKDHDYAALEMYRLASLIYLERASRNFSGTSKKIEHWLSSAFNLLQVPNIRMKHSFPTFIVGCEARTDQQRIIILDSIDKSQMFQATAPMAIVRDMLQSAWALEDLETDRELNYMTKLDTVISGCEMMPTFA